MNIQNVAIIGECMVELHREGTMYQQGFGGDTLNTATYLSRLTHSSGIETSYLTGLGKDEFSRRMIEAWQKDNINTDKIDISETKLPGLYAIETDANGERRFFYWRNDAAAKFWIVNHTVDSLSQLLSHYQMIYLSGISLAILPQSSRQTLIEALALCRSNGATISFDNNFRPALWESIDAARENYAQLLKNTDIAFLTYDDEQALYGDTSEEQTIKRTMEFGVKEIVIKRGAEPCFVVTNQQTIEEPAKRVEKVVDTTAAGDSFSAGYLAKRLLGGSLSESAQAGHLLASTVIQYPGAVIPKEATPNL
ncbi:sugar kinase [Vibrio viridaestus]|uniref:2-dehydro-3-deoxygluconokinase n=1 Tax=Vibrio viridaestus TaxID=2487322 RepID=A0A3N9TL45_9VIBR|nr:sugar kinase [Vibrio viridaestus]RQW64997.1 sugar kinase [Vibrio viridaestus]